MFSIRGSESVATDAETWIMVNDDEPAASSSPISGFVLSLLLSEPEFFQAARIFNKMYIFACGLTDELFVLICIRSAAELPPITRESSNWRTSS